MIRLSAWALVAALVAESSLAQEQKFAPGEIVIVPMYGKPEEAQVVRQDASGVLVRQKHWQDGTYKPDGPTRHYATSEVSKKPPPTPQAAVAPDASAGTSVAPPDLSRMKIAVNSPAAAGPSGAVAGEDPLTREQVIGFFAARVGTDGPHPMKAQACAEMRDLIKKRGVDFKYNSATGSEIHKAGGDMSVCYVIQANLGKPPELKWFVDEWDVTFTTIAGFAPSLDNAARFGFVAIETGNKYLWKVSPDDPPEKWIDGRWRLATSEEMNYYGGTGIVLLNGEQGEDWIVHKDDTAPRDQEWINIAQLDSRQTRRGGKRAGSASETKDNKP